MTSDGKWNCNNVLGTRFQQVKPTCHLLPVLRNADFSFSADDFSAIISNLHAIEDMADPRKTGDTYSVVTSDVAFTKAIRLSHHLFVVRFCFAE
jgi:hypothetical protein